MKKVFSDAEQTIHVWAQQTQSEGRSGNVFFEGATVYSYGHHYPLGLIATNKKGEKAAIINDSGYSVTTSKHIGIARQAVNHYTRFYLPNTEAMKAIRRAIDYDQPERIINGLSEAIERTVANYKSSLMHDTKKRKAATLEKWKDSALSECNQYLTILEWFSLKPNKAANKTLKELSGKSPIEAKESAKKAAEKAAKERARKQAEQDKIDAAIIEQAKNAWLAGDDYFIADNAHGKHYTKQWIFRHKETLLRINGDDIETSKGASFPIEHAKKAFPIIRMMKEKGESWKRNGKTIHLGHFQIDEISPEGDVKAGCHLVKWPEIEACAIALKIYP